MFKTYWCAVLMSACVIVNVAHADDAALLQTQDCLKNHTCEASKTAEGRAAEQKALEAVGGNAALGQEMNNLAAEIMPVILQQSGGDPAKMQALLLKSQADPESFLHLLPADVQAKVKNIATQVENNKANRQ